MPTRSDAEEHLRIIRSLMEKATIYRAISAPTALVGGLTATTVAIFFHQQTDPVRSNFYSEMANGLFLGGWLTALIVTAAANGVFLWRDAVRRGDKFLSPGMRAAFRALGPNYLVAGVLTLIFAQSADLLTVPWMLLYALGLLATQHFAPRSIAWLGWAFLAAGLLVMLTLSAHEPPTPVTMLRNANVAMGLTFGLFHLIYAACTWPRRGRASDTGAAP